MFQRTATPLFNGALVAHKQTAQQGRQTPKSYRDIFTLMVSKCFGVRVNKASKQNKYVYRYL